MLVAEPRELVRDWALIMDEQYPGWYDDIDLRTLAISRADHCVLEQTMGDYSDGYAALRRLYPHRSVNAFEPVNGRTGEDWNAFASGGATKFWKEEIVARRAAKTGRKPQKEVVEVGSDSAVV